MNQVLNDHQPTVPDRKGSVALEERLASTSTSTATPTATSTAEWQGSAGASASASNSDNVSGSGVSSAGGRSTQGVSVVEAHLVTPTHTVMAVGSAHIIRPASTLEFKNVTFSYRKSKSGILKTATQLSDLSGDPNSIENKDLSAQLRDSKEVLLDNVSFTINSGENVAIVGPSGSGECFIRCSSACSSLHFNHCYV